MKNHILTSVKSSSLFFKALLLLILCSFLYMIFVDQYIYINDHSFLLNVFFINYTFMGDAIFAVCLSAFFIFYLKQQKTGFALLFAFLFSEVVIQVIKNLLNVYDAGIFVEAGQTVINPGVQNNSAYYHFPSGHTAIAFALATVFLFVLKNKTWQLPILCAAVLLAYSRIYLAQHSLPDILIGAVVGTFLGITAVHIAYNWKTIGNKFRSMHKINNENELPSGTIQTV